MAIKTTVIYICINKGITFTLYILQLYQKYQDNFINRNKKLFLFCFCL